MRYYGKELLLDLHGCDVATFTRKSLRGYFGELCDLMEVTPDKLYFWDDLGLSKKRQETDPKRKGTSAVQFILKSNITVHTLDLTGKVFVNVFSCGNFNVRKVSRLTQKWFKGKIVSSGCFARV